MDVDEAIERVLDDSLRNAVSHIVEVSENFSLNPYCRNDWGKFYKHLYGKVNVDVPILTMLLKNWVWIKSKYEKDFGKPYLMLVKTLDKSLQQ